MCVCAASKIFLPSQANQVYILDRPVFFNFSTSQEITRLELAVLRDPLLYTLLTHACVCLLLPL